MYYFQYDDWPTSFTFSKRERTDIMKFSQSKKAKIRKKNQNKINRYCSNMTGCYIYDGNNRYEVMDQAKINDTMYLLVQGKDGQYTIWKIVKVGEYVRLSNKKVLQNYKKFSNHANWRLHSTIQISDDGTIESAMMGSFMGPYNMSRNQFTGETEIIVFSM